jgi:uncharacterized protein YjbI with pentapeptide repeats
MTRLLLALFFVCLVAKSFAAPQDLHGKDLSHKEMKNEALNRADLSGANLQSTDLTNATMQGAILRGADLQGANLTTADLSEADLRGANLKQAKLQDAKFVKANLEGDDVYLANGVRRDEETIHKQQRALENAGADIAVLAQHNGYITFKEANLRGAKLHGSLDGADFRRADLRGANFADITDPGKAKWRGAIYDATTRWPDGFNFTEAGAVMGQVAPATGANLPNDVAFHPIGSWMIKTEAKGATEEGLLTVSSDKTFKWDYSVKAEPVTGTWKSAGDKSGAIVLTKGEGSTDWIMQPASAHPDRPDSAELKQINGSGQRWAVPVSASKN